MAPGALIYVPCPESSAADDHQPPVRRPVLRLGCEGPGEQGTQMKTYLLRCTLFRPLGLSLLELL